MIDDPSACIAFLLKRCFYVHGSLLSVAHYPKALAKIGRIDERNKKMMKKLRKVYVNALLGGKIAAALWSQQRIKKGWPQPPKLTIT